MSRHVPIIVAQPPEAAEYARFVAGVFRVTYKHGYEEARLERHIARYFGESQQAAELRDPARWTLRAADDDGRWHGFVMVRRDTVPPAAVIARRPAELARLYVGVEAQGGGLGRRLVETAAARAAAEGHDALWLTVWRHNENAKRFYERLGFVRTGTHPFTFDGVPELDDLYVLALDER